MKKKKRKKGKTNENSTINRLKTHQKSNLFFRITKNPGTLAPLTMCLLFGAQIGLRNIKASTPASPIWREGRWIAQPSASPLTGLVLSMGQPIPGFYPTCFGRTFRWAGFFLFPFYSSRFSFFFLFLLRFFLFTFFLFF